jgi:hypothetical protein
VGEFAHSFEEPSYPRDFILMRLEACGFQQLIGLGVPPTIRELAPQHRGHRQSLLNDAHCQVSFGEVSQRFLDVPACAMVDNHDLQAIEGASVVVPSEIPPGDKHFPFGKIVLATIQGLAGARRLIGGRRGLLAEQTSVRDKQRQKHQGCEADDHFRSHSSERGASTLAARSGVCEATCAAYRAGALARISLSEVGRS